MTTGLIVFARMGSRRLPGKSLLDIGGRPLLGHVIDRARNVPGHHPIVIATTERRDDDAIADFAKHETVAVFRGSENDVAGRALECARAFGFGRFARICGDRPFFDPTIVGRLFRIMSDTGCDVATTMFPRTLPPGLTAEVVATPALARLCAATDDAADREHVTAYFYRNPQSYKIRNLDPEAPDELTGLCLVVDDATDLERARAIVARLPGAAAAAPIAQIARLAREWDRRTGAVVREGATAR